ncbi:AraC family transcriptional regulator [Micromonospora endolithica]|uniref:AraC family transcriptional regulator n=1 Tax=Micromonospora endolithica TaxID=230091 RepID=A0A3A9ZRP2_9ACTN|nr:AraC family transcriptional regulator [Micromonospora endolithica]RKN50938.1 AraC family transcriptional regulator [Micromonospora endolithica]TWJ20285.1 AraC family transcriptional regulator [Micromonospora endolithica]
MLERLNQVMDHIERHLDEPVEVAELARIAATSEYHLRRLFSALAGIGLSEYIRRRRLTIACAEVLAGERTLLDVAVRHGYGSAEAFARAFHAVHGVGPGEARRTGAALRSQPRMSFRLIVEGSSSMRYRIVEKDGFRLVGRKARVPLVHEGMNPAIVSFVKGLDAETKGRIEALSDQEPRGVVNVSDGLAGDRSEGTELDYWYGVVTGADVPEDLDALPVAAGSWAVFEASGAFPQAVQHLWRDVFTQWFPSNPYRSRPGPEISRTRISADGAHADAELWIPVERVPA